MKAVNSTRTKNDAANQKMMLQFLLKIDYCCNIYTNIHFAYVMPGMAFRVKFCADFYCAKIFSDILVTTMQILHFTAIFFYPTNALHTSKGEK
jgi:hypothetical protein